jgi:hypothetical protein
MTMDAADFLFDHLTGPRASVRVCKVCKHAETVKTGLRNAGRGYGMREGNKARGRMIQHIKSAHPDELAKMEATPFGKRQWPTRPRT